MDELEDFKTHINLSEYAAAQGYEIDRRASSKNSVLMRHRGGDKIVIACGTDRPWIYFSIRDDADNGSIIDFVQNRKGVKLGDETSRTAPTRQPKPQPQRAAVAGSAAQDRQCGIARAGNAGAS